MSKWKTCTYEIIFSYGSQGLMHYGSLPKPTYELIMAKSICKRNFHCSARLLPFLCGIGERLDDLDMYVEDRC